MNLSYWERESWLNNIDFTIVGSGIVGLTCALTLRKNYPSANILVLEKGFLPQGASTKNAGFACFGSITELLNDLKFQTNDELLQLVTKRWHGLQQLRELIGDEFLDYQQHGSYELFFENDETRYRFAVENIEHINSILQPLFKEDVFQLKGNPYKFKKILPYVMYNKFEGQLDTGKLMKALLNKCHDKNIRILNCTELKLFEEFTHHVSLVTNHFTLNTKKLIIATNGFASQLIKEKVQPARAQVLITKPIKKLAIKGTFHIDEGYYYFRNINDRILFGGARNLNIQGETTTEFGQTEEIQNRLEEILKTVILPHYDYEIDYKWSGIMGLGHDKIPIVKQLSNHVYCGVKLGGMGIAIGTNIGKELAALI
ncbi:NAD(P)/FAD-dependent oxidoreductase [Zhouia sp. PK063]|uniref:NAD(P)/FAD-dependent oxidoreductase n=1 Tax=Zhouia sp. PK063 TaxID=3373602 RepID=UPI0037BB0A50